MTTASENIEEMKLVRRIKSVCKEEDFSASTKDLFDEQWKIFVVKKDKATGKLIGKVACCALAPV